jgi:hypothetical protein
MPTRKRTAAAARSGGVSPALRRAVQRGAKRHAARRQGARQQEIFDVRDAARRQAELVLKKAARHQKAIKRLSRQLRRETVAADHALVSLYHFLKVHPSIADDLKQAALYDDLRRHATTDGDDIPTSARPEPANV